MPQQPMMMQHTSQLEQVFHSHRPQEFVPQQGFQQNNGSIQPQPVMTLPNESDSSLNSNSSKKKPWICSLCHAGFARSHDLKRHSLMHTKERSHKCPVCGAAFARKVRFISYLLQWLIDPGRSLESYSKAASLVLRILQEKYAKSSCPAANR